MTGCTVVLLPAGTVASGEVRGGAPGTREWALLDPRRSVDRIDAVVLCGGSAFGLAACEGVVHWCEERGTGWPTSAGPVPIVVGLVIYDLGVGDPAVRPGPAEGYAACEASVSAAPGLRGRVGAATGATVGKWRGAGPAPAAGGPAPAAGGLGHAVVRDGDLVVGALMVVNAIGEPLGGPGGDGEPRPRIPVAGSSSVGPVGGLGSTTLGVVVTNARMDKLGCLRVAEAGHDGLARALDPVHTAADGDALVAAATGEVDAPVETVRALGAWVVERAIADALD